MQELLDVATKHTTSEEVVQANFSGKGKAAAHLSSGDDGDDSAVTYHHRDKRGKDKKHRGEEKVVVADRATRPQPHEKGPRPKHFHGVRRAKHLLKDCKP